VVPLVVFQEVVADLVAAEAVVLAASAAEASAVAVLAEAGRRSVSSSKFQVSS
jgi:hypothetical protein